MRFVPILSALAVALVAAGCSPVYVDYDYDRSANFAAFKTWAWYADVHPEAKANQAAQMQNPLAAKRLEALVEEELKEKALTRTQTSPDLLVVYYTASQHATQITRNSYWNTVGSTSVQHYQDGTLIIDFLDPANEHLLWRGTAETTLSSNPPPEEIDKTVKKAVQKILGGYPPK